MPRISGTFDVTLNPLSTYHDAATLLGRRSIDKRFHGSLSATSKGEMLSAQTGTKGSAGYVAIELVEGTLQGRAGTFVLQHYGLMNRGAQELNVTVVPDSGTGELAGLAGRLAIRIVDGQHFYDFEYSLPE